MLNPLSRKDKRLLLFVTAFLLLSGTSSGSSIHRLIHLSPADRPLSGNYLLNDTPTNAKLKRKDGKTSRYIHTERNSDLIIAIPDALKIRYKIRFLDVDNHLLFEIAEVQDSLLVVEKYNFRHAGHFQYELYKENMLMERHTFQIKKD